MGRRGRGGNRVGHAVAAREANIIWEECNGIFHPVKTETGEALEAVARRQGSPVDARSGLPAHTTTNPRITAQQQGELAREYGYEPYSRGQTSGAKQPVFYNQEGEPPFISYDRDGHGASRDPGEPGRIPWKGSDNGRFGRDDRTGTYNPVYDDDGNIVFQRGRR